MPYIDQKSRSIVAPDAMTAASAGELNYQITCLIEQYLVVHAGKNYSAINEVIGVLECAKMEFYRRIAAPYEDKKIEENGDVYITAKI